MTLVQLNPARRRKAFLPLLGLLAGTGLALKHFHDSGERPDALGLAVLVFACLAGFSMARSLLRARIRIVDIGGAHLLLEEGNDKSQFTASEVRSLRLHLFQGHTLSLLQRDLYLPPYYDGVVELYERILSARPDLAKEKATAHGAEFAKIERLDEVDSVRIQLSKKEKRYLYLVVPLELTAMMLLLGVATHFFESALQALYLGAALYALGILFNATMVTKLVNLLASLDRLVRRIPAMQPYRNEAAYRTALFWLSRAVLAGIALFILLDAGSKHN